MLLADSSQQQLFVRDVKSSGYGSTVNIGEDVGVEGDVKEWLSGPVFRINEKVPAKTLHLPVEDAPLVPCESDTAKWANPDDYNGNDHEKLQAALNSGKPAGVYLLRRNGSLRGRVHSVPYDRFDHMRADSKSGQTGASRNAVLR